MRKVKINYAKCAGCAALLDKGSSYHCSLKFSIGFERIEGKAYSAYPKEKCYKPRTSQDLESLK